MLKRERLMRLCKGMFIIGSLGLEACFLIGVFCQNIMCGVMLTFLCLAFNSAILYIYLLNRGVM